VRLAADESRAVEAQAFLKEVARLGCRLISLRPSMSSPIANAVVRALDAISRKPEKTTTVNSLRQATHRIVERLLAVSLENVERAAEQACQLVPERLPGQGARVLTHSYSETCLLALRACKHKNLRVYVTESRPLFEERKTATALRDAGIDVTLLTDAQAGHFMAGTDLVLVGADTVLPEGSVVSSCCGKGRKQ
jgi:translation initiation factor 2B subunit (eIF-2B alpha/beta/delta family)